MPSSCTAWNHIFIYRQYTICIYISYTICILITTIQKIHRRSTNDSSAQATRLSAHSGLTSTRLTSDSPHSTQPTQFISEPRQFGTPRKLSHSRDTTYRVLTSHSWQIISHNIFTTLGICNVQIKFGQRQWPSQQFRTLGCAFPNVLKRIVVTENHYAWPEYQISEATQCLTSNTAPLSGHTGIH